MSFQKMQLVITLYSYMYIYFIQNVVSKD